MLPALISLNIQKPILETYQEFSKYSELTHICRNAKLYELN